MSEPTVMRIEGEVDCPLSLTMGQLREIAPQEHVTDLIAIGYRRHGAAIRLQDLLAAVGASDRATHLGLHASRDNFHASIPLDAVRDRGVLVFSHNGRDIPSSEGGPLRFFIPDHAACKMDEVDECANVKFVDRIELTTGKGMDNRPANEDEHRRLHAGD